MASRPKHPEAEPEELADLISPDIPDPDEEPFITEDDIEVDPTNIPLKKLRRPFRHEDSWYPEDYGSDDNKDAKPTSKDTPDADVQSSHSSATSVELDDANTGEENPKEEEVPPDEHEIKGRLIAPVLSPEVKDETDVFRLVEKDKDIGTDPYWYKHHLNAMKSDFGRIRTELHWIVRKNQLNKLKLACEFLNEHEKFSLSSDELRGDDNETVLCLAVMKRFGEGAKILVDYGGRDLIVKTYSKTDYKGTTALHLAILKQDLPIIKRIMEELGPDDRREQLHKEASGSYFRNIYKCACKPLSLAAAVGNMAIFNVLVEYGADLWSEDTGTGNTVMHNLALLAAYSPDHATETMEHIISPDNVAVREWWKETKKKLVQENKDFVYGDSLEVGLLKAENANGDTPFTYAASVGAIKFSSAILDMRNIYKFPQWNIGPVKFTIYEMNEIDPAVPETLPPPPNKTASRSSKRASALESFAFILGDDKLNFGALAAMRKAMDNKWESYRCVFYAWMVIHFILMVFFTLCVQYRVLTSLADNTTDNTATQNPDPVEVNTSVSGVTDVLLDSELSAKDKGVLVLECLVLIIAVFYFILELVDFFMLLAAKRCSAGGYMKSQQGKIHIYRTVQFDIFRLLLFIFSLSVVIALFLRIARSPWQDMAYAVAAICGWSFMLFFTRADKNIGIFTIMLQRMITRELLYFSVVFLAIMCGFGTATYCLFQESLQVPGEVASVPQTLFSHFRLLIGLEELNIAEESRLPWLVKLVFMAFVLLSNILLLNMLIAAMNNTYTQMDTMKELLWLRMRTKAVLMIERRIPRKLRPNCNLENYGRKKQWFIGTEEVRAWHPLAGGL